MRWCVVAGLVLALAPARVRAEGRPGYGGEVEGTLLGAPVVLDPPEAVRHAELTAIELVFDTLYRYGPDGTIVPHLASALPAVDGARARITVRAGVRFHDGSPLTATDVAASLERIRTTPARWITSVISAVRVDGDAVELTLKAPTAELAALLALPQTSVTPRGAAATDRPVGSGPFVVERFDRVGRRLVVRAFDDHFAGRPYLDRLVLRWHDTPDGEARQFERGDAQLSARGAAVFTGAVPKYRAVDVEGPAALLLFVGFGRKHMDVTTDRAFRRALDLALARRALTSVGWGERVVPTRLPLPVEAGAPALTVAGRADNLAAARLALADAARRVKALTRARLPALVLEILVDASRPDDREVAERVARGLTKLGIRSGISPVAARVLRERVRRGDCDLWIGHTIAPVTAASAWWGGAFGAGGDSWAEQQLATGAVSTASAIKVFTERLPIVPLAFRAVRIWHRSDVRGLRFDTSGRPCLADLFLFGAPVRAKGRP